MVDRKMLRLSAALLVAGSLVWILAGLFHPGGDANNHPVEFGVYANSGNWTAVHLGQFVGMAILIAGLVVLFFALGASSGAAGIANRFAVVSAAVALGLYGVLQAVDGVALKQAVDAWATAPAAEKPIRFASAESIRWLEWGVRSYQGFMLGLAFIMFAAVIILTERLPRAIGLLFALTGLAFVIQGWVLGFEGFSAAFTLAAILGIVLILAGPIWLSIVAWRRKETIPATRA